MNSAWSRRSRLVAAILLMILAAGADAGDNLVRNPFFSPEGDDPVPEWTVRRVAGRTNFSIEDGVLVAERKPGSTTAADSVLQMVYLPEDPKAVRVAVRASPDRMGRAEVELRFARDDGSPGGRKTLFHVNGTHPMRLFEKDVLLPPDTKDVEINIKVFTPGRLLIEEVRVEVVEPGEVRAEARLVEVEGRFYVTASGTAAVESAQVVLPIPPPGATQCPVSLMVRPEPDGRLQSVKVVREFGLDRVHLKVGPLEPDYRVRLRWTARLILTDQELSGDPPESIEIAPSRHLKRQIAVWAGRPVEEEVLGFARRTLSDSNDLLVVAERTARALSRGIARAVDGPGAPAEVVTAKKGSPAGRANLAASVFRVADVPAQPILWLPIGGRGRTGAVLAFHPDFEWLLFTLDPRDPRPLPRSRGVVLARALEKTGFHTAKPGIAGPECAIGYETREGPPFQAVEIGTITLPKGAGPELMDALRQAWSKGTRRFDLNSGCGIDPKRLALRGAAKKLKPALVDLIGNQED